MKILGNKQHTNGLIVKHRKHAIILECINGEENILENNYLFSFAFTPDEFRKFAEYIKEISNVAWNNVKPKLANSEGSDYYEYYDRRYDNNGYLSIVDKKKHIELHVEAPYGSKDTLYQFNKPKIQSFIYDINELLDGMKI